MSLEFARRFVEHMANHRGKDGEPVDFDGYALRGLELLEASPGALTCRLPVARWNRNCYGVLHGGCMATVVDTVGTAVMMTVTPKGGMSLSINVNYLSKLPLAGAALVKAQVVKVGRNIATITVDLTDEKTGAIVAKGTHVKFISQSEPPLEEVLAADRQGQPQRSKL